MIWFLQHLRVIDENAPFVTETDASNNAVSASFNQKNRPVAFFSRMLSKSEIRHSSVEKEATAIVDAIRKWSQFFSGRRFTLITDQQAVSFTVCTKQQILVKLRTAKFLVGEWNLV